MAGSYNGIDKRDGTVKAMRLAKRTGRLWGFQSNALALEVVFRIRVAWPNGTPVSDTGWLPSHTLVEQFIRQLQVQLSQVNDSGIVDITSTTRTFAPSVGVFNAAAAAGQTTRGIVVGTGTTAVTQTDRAIQTLIAEGTGAGQLSYGAVSVNAATTSGNEASVTFDRQATNNSGATITIQEAAWYALTDDSGSVARTWMHGRTITGATAVLNTQVATISCKVRTTNVGCINFFKILACQLAQANLAGVVDTSGTSNTIVINSINFSAIGGVNVEPGILVGNAAAPAAFAPANTTTANRVADGNGADQLEYLATVVGAVRVVGANRRVLETRSWRNDNAAALTNGITDYGVVLFARGSGGSNINLLVSRTVPTALPVASGATAVIEAQHQI